MAYHPPPHHAARTRGGGAVGAEAQQSSGDSRSVGCNKPRCPGTNLLVSIPPFMSEPQCLSCCPPFLHAARTPRCQSAPSTTHLGNHSKFVLIGNRMAGVGRTEGRVDRFRRVKTLPLATRSEIVNVHVSTPETSKNATTCHTPVDSNYTRFGSPLNPMLA